MSLETCPICYELLHDLNLIKSECCRKDIHVACLYQWLFANHNTKCPLCRHVFSPVYRQRLGEAYLEDTWPTPRVFQLESLVGSEIPLNLLKLSLTKYQLMTRGSILVFQTSPVHFTYQTQFHLNLLPLELDNLNQVIDRLNQLIQTYQLVEDFTKFTPRLNPLVVNDNADPPTSSIALVRSAHPMRMEFMVELDFEISPPCLILKLVGEKLDITDHVPDFGNWECEQLDTDCLYRPPPKGKPTRY